MEKKFSLTMTGYAGTRDDLEDHTRTKSRSVTLKIIIPGKALELLKNSQMLPAQ